MSATRLLGHLVATKPALAPADKLVLVFIASCAGPDGTTPPLGIDQIAAAVNVSRRRVSRAFHVLREKVGLQVLNNPGGASCFFVPTSDKEVS